MGGHSIIGNIWATFLAAKHKTASWVSSFSQTGMQISGNQPSRPPAPPPKAPVGPRVLHRTLLTNRRVCDDEEKDFQKGQSPPQPERDHHKPRCRRPPLSASRCGPDPNSGRQSFGLADANNNAQKTNKQGISEG